MKKKEKEKRPYSAVNNFGYTLRMLFGYNAWYPVITILSTLLSLGVAVWATYENKFFLDELESGSPSGRVLIAVAGIVGIGLLGTVTSTITSYFLRDNRKTVRSAALDLVRERLDDFEALSEEDVEEICGILKGLKQRENAAAPNIKGSRERRKT